MPYLFSILLLISLFSCQKNSPSNEEQQRAEQIAAEQKIEADFAKVLVQQRENLQTKQGQDLAYIAPQKATELLQTAQLLFNLDSTLTPPSASTHAAQHGGLLLHVRNHAQTLQQIYALAKEQGLIVLQETEETEKYKKGSIIQLEAPAHKMQTTLEQINDWAAVLRKKELWQLPSNNEPLRIKSQLIVTKQRLQDLSDQLEETPTIEEQLLLKEHIAQLAQNLELTVLNLRKQAADASPSTLTIAFYQDLKPDAPAPTTFSADLSSNLEVGWVQFKQFLLQMALIWPYIIIGLLFLITILLAIGNSRKKAREFKLKMLHRQQPLVQPIVVDNKASL